MDYMMSVQPIDTFHWHARTAYTRATSAVAEEQSGSASFIHTDWHLIRSIQRRKRRLLVSFGCVHAAHIHRVSCENHIDTMLNGFNPNAIYASAGQSWAIGDNSNQRKIVPTMSNAEQSSQILAHCASILPTVASATHEDYVWLSSAMIVNNAWNIDLRRNWQFSWMAHTLTRTAFLADSFCW